MKIQFGKYPKTVKYVGTQGASGNMPICLTQGHVYDVHLAGIDGSFGYIKVRNDKGRLREYSARGFDEVKAEREQVTGDKYGLS